MENNINILLLFYLLNINSVRVYSYHFIRCYGPPGTLGFWRRQAWLQILWLFRGFSVKVALGYCMGHKGEKLCHYSPVWPIPSCLPETFIHFVKQVLVTLSKIDQTLGPHDASAPTNSLHYIFITLRV